MGQIGLLEVYVGGAAGVVYVDVGWAERLGKFRFGVGCVPEGVLESLLGLKRSSLIHTPWQLFNLAYPSPVVLCCSISQTNKSSLAIQSSECL